jgi:hypothetical protein
MAKATDQILYSMASERTGIVRPFRLTVLVPVYNERHMVELALRRLLGIRDDLIAELEIIVVDHADST